MKYRKKPVIIDAILWDGKFDTDPGIIRRYTGPTGFCEVCGESHGLHGWIATLEAGHQVCPGDWIITGVKSERYPIKPDIFELTYEKVE